MNDPKINDAGLSGGVAIVTGGSRGIGRAIVEILAASGMEVVFTYRDNAAAAGEVIAANPGKKIFAEKVDARDSAACAAFAEKIIERAGKIDLLVNNAGVIRDNLLAMLADDDIKAVLDTNVTGTFNMTRAVAPYMISKRRGKIVNISSVSGEKGGRGQTNYAASKGAVNAFTKALAVELAPRGITVNAVAPGVIETEMSKHRPRTGRRPDSVADFVEADRQAGRHRQCRLVFEFKICRLHHGRNFACGRRIQDGMKKL
jgi:3-oxoacyl-[acyl-carrier protein] reductase